jgi:hypothetical protein
MIQWNQFGFNALYPITNEWNQNKNIFSHYSDSYETVNKVAIPNITKVFSFFLSLSLLFFCKFQTSTFSFNTLFQFGRLCAPHAFVQEWRWLVNMTLGLIPLTRAVSS